MTQGFWRDFGERGQIRKNKKTNKMIWSLKKKRRKGKKKKKKKKREIVIKHTWFRCDSSGKMASLYYVPLAREVMQNFFGCALSISWVCWMWCEALVVWTAKSKLDELPRLSLLNLYVFWEFKRNKSCENRLQDVSRTQAALVGELD